MPMDGLTVGFAARELDDILRDGRIDKITQPERDTVVLVIRAGGANHRLLLCASPNNARCHLTMNSYSNPLEPPAMCMLMRKQIAGARITGVRQVDGDRIVHVDMDAVKTTSRSSSTTSATAHSTAGTTYTNATTICGPSIRLTSCYTATRH